MGRSRRSRPLAVFASLGAAAGVVMVPAYAEAGPGGASTPGWQSVKSSPQGRALHVDKARHSAARATVGPAGIFTIDATAAANSTGGNEPGIAVSPVNPNQIAITRFTFGWNGDADLLYSTDGGVTWTNETSIPPPPGVPGTAGCPCDQTIDYGRDGTLYGTFLTAAGNAGTRVVTGSTSDPTQASSWQWHGNPAQLSQRHAHQRRSAMAARRPRPHDGQPGQRLRRLRRLRR